MTSHSQLENNELPTLRPERNIVITTDDHPDDHRNESYIHTHAYKYIVILAASLVLFIGVGYSNTFGVFQEYYETHTLSSENPEKVITIGSVSASLYLILGAFAGRFADLVGYRAALIIGSSLMIGGMFAASAAKSFVQLLLSQGIMFGLGVAFAYAPTTAISKMYWHQNHGVANAVVVSGGALGGCILPFFVRLMINEFGLSQTFRVLGYVAAGVLIPSSLVLRPKEISMGLRRRRAAAQERPPLMDLSLLKNREFVALSVACTVAMVGFLPRYFLIPPSAVAQGIGTTYASWLLGMMNGLSIIGRIGIGWFADRSGKVNALTASFVLCGVGHFLFWIPAVMVNNSGSATALFTLFVVYTGIFGSGFISLFPVVVAHLFGADSLASKNGLLNTILGLGTLAGPSAAYAIIGAGSTTHWWYGVSAAGLFMFVGGVTLGGLLASPWKRMSTGRADRRSDQPE